MDTTKDIVKYEQHINFLVGTKILDAITLTSKIGKTWVITIPTITFTLLIK